MWFLRARGGLLQLTVNHRVSVSFLLLLSVELVDNALTRHQVQGQTRIL